MLRTSSRIWRGSMSSRDWKYLSQGAWAPRAKGRSRKARSRAAAGGGGAQKRGRGSAGAIGGGGGAAGTTASGTGGAASEIAGGGRGGDGGHHSEEPDVASPRKRPRRAKSAGGSPASSGSDGEDDGHMGAFQRLPGSGGGSGGGRAAPVAVPRGVPRQANAAEARQRAAGRPQDPLVGWFVHHFTLLDRAGERLDKTLTPCHLCGLSDGGLKDAGARLSSARQWLQSPRSAAQWVPVPLSSWIIFVCQMCRAAGGQLHHLLRRGGVPAALPARPAAWQRRSVRR